MQCGMCSVSSVGLTVTEELRAERHWVGGRLGRTSWRWRDLERLAEMGVGRTLKYLRRRDFSRVDVLEQDQVCWGRRGGTLGMVAQACWPSDSCGPPGGYEQKHLPVGLHTQGCHLGALQASSGVQG